MHSKQPSHFLLCTELVLALTRCGGGTSPTADTTPEQPGSISQEQQVPDTSTTAQFPAAEAHASAVLTYAVIDAPNGTFGYDVFSNGQLLLHQTNMPGQPGVEGCKTKADVEKLAAFVIEKIKKGLMPPTVETEELRTLELIN